MSDFKKDANALTEDPIVMLDWRNYTAMFGAHEDPNFNDRHLTNYEALWVKLHNVYESNKASAHANAGLITKLRKKLKKIKKALKS